MHIEMLAVKGVFRISFPKQKKNARKESAWFVEVIPLTKWLKKAPPSLKRPNSQVCLILFTFWGGVLLSSSFFGVRHCSCSDSDRFLTCCRNHFLNAIYVKAGGDEAFFIWVWCFYLGVPFGYGWRGGFYSLFFWIIMRWWYIWSVSLICFSAFLFLSKHEWLRWSHEPKPEKSLTFRNCWGKLAKKVLGTSK